MILAMGLAAMAFLQGTTETEVKITGAGGMVLSGTLSIPKHAPGVKVPGVLLLPGSGPTDRNGNQPPQLVTNLLKEISTTLNQSGFATLRFDKRASHTYMPLFKKMKSEDYSEFFKWENFVDDATNAMRFLQSQPSVDGKRVAIIGHSEGSEIALQIGSNLAGKKDQPAAIVTMGGAGRPMGPILHEQIGRALDKQKQAGPVRKMYLDAVDKATAQVAKTGTFPADVPPGLSALFNPSVAKLMQSYCRIDPCDLAKNYPGDVLVLNGANDTQVSPERDTPKLEAALKARSKGATEVLIVPNTSHNFKPTTGKNDDAYEGPVNPIALDKIKMFLTKHLHP